MNLNIISKDFPNICRLCLSRGSLQPIREISVLDVLCTITNIKVKEEEKLPENVCNDCIKHLEDIAAFIDICRNNDETLRTIILNDHEKSLTTKEAADEVFDKDDQCDDDVTDNDNDDVKVKDENEIHNTETIYFSHNIKEEFLDESDTTDINLNEDGPASCENCSETFLNRKSLDDHYNEIVNCRPRGYIPGSISESYSLDYLKNEKDETELSVVEKDNLEDEEPEYVNGRKLKGKRRFLCNYCGKNYTRKNGLERHILSHTGVKPFECKECGKRYFTKDTLKTHILTHTGVRAHICSICSKSFTQSSHLSYHLRRHSGEKPYSCAVCGKGFRSNYHLERHKLTHTGVKPIKNLQ